MKPGREAPYLKDLDDPCWNSVNWSPNHAKKCNRLQPKPISDHTIKVKRESPQYCTISSNLAPSMTCYQLAKISISAGPRFKHDIQIFLAGEGVNFVQEACKLSIVNWSISITYIMYVNAIGECEIRGSLSTSRRVLACETAEANSRGTRLRVDVVTPGCGVTRWVSCNPGVGTLSPSAGLW